MKTKPYSIALGLALLLGFTPSLFAQNSTWNVDDGSWTNAANWAGAGVPVLNNAVGTVFMVGGTTSTALTNTVSVSGTAYPNQLIIGKGKTVILNLDNGANLASSGATWSIGNKNPGVGTGASHLTINGPLTGSATVAANNFIVGHLYDYSGPGTTLTLSKTNLTTTTSIASWVGYYNNDNVMTVSNGATLNLAGVSIGNNNRAGEPEVDYKAMSGNKVVVDNATLNVSGNVYVAQQSGTPSSFADTSHDNSITVQNGGHMAMNGTGDFWIGVYNGQYENYLKVTGTNSLAEITNASRTLYIGGTTPNNLGGNYTLVDNGGKLTTKGVLNVQGYDSGNINNKGANRLVIGNGGTLATENTINNLGLVRVESGATLHSSGTLNVSGTGLLQLSSGGIIAGKNIAGTNSPMTINVESTGRFEAAGSGLATNVSTFVKSGGTFAIGLNGAPTASTLNLNSPLSLANGSTFEAAIFSASAMDSVAVGTSAALSIDTTAKLQLVLLNGYNPVYGDSWTLFSGDISKITGMFDLSNAILPSLSGGNYWTLTSDGSNWNVNVVPEPGTITLLGLAGMAVLFCRRRQR